MIAHYRENKAAREAQRGYFGSPEIKLAQIAADRAIAHARGIAFSALHNLTLRMIAEASLLEWVVAECPNHEQVLIASRRVKDAFSEHANRSEAGVSG